MSKSNIGKRPSGCGNKSDKSCTGCGIFPSPGKISTTWGMPSGHAQITSFAATYWSIYLWMKYKQEENIDVKESLKKHALVGTILMEVLCLIVCYQNVIVYFR